MKKITVQILLGLLAAATARADTALTIPAYYGCLLDFGSPVAIPSPPTIVGTFSLTGVSGAGSIQSQVPSYWDEHVPPANTEQKLYIYSYTIDLSGMSAPGSHCVKLLIHFGSPAGCFGPGVNGDPGRIQSATLGPWGDITFVFNGGCLNPGQTAVSFSMVGEPGFKTNIVTVIDDYVNPANNTTNETRINVPAIVPDIPPDPPPWVIAYYYSRVNPVLFQGNLANLVGTNQTVTNLPANGNYDMTLQLLNTPTNGPAVSQVVTQTVQVVNGLFNLPLPFDPISMGDGSTHWLSLGVRQSYTGNTFSGLVPAVQLSPTPQAFYAFTAGTVADLTPDQAVLSLNGITGNTVLQGGPGIQVTLNGDGKTITISQTGQPSDRNIKTDFAGVKPDDILNKLLALPIQSWRFTNEVAGVHHVGPMAQDFKAAFGLGTGDTTIGIVDEGGVALSAIQGLNQKVEAENAELRNENAELKSRLEKLELLTNHQNGGAK